MGLLSSIKQWISACSRERGREECEDNRLKLEKPDKISCQSVGLRICFVTFLQFSTAEQASNKTALRNGYKNTPGAQEVLVTERH